MKLLSIVLLAISAFVFAGCDSGTQTPPPAPDTNATPAPAPAK